MLAVNATTRVYLYMRDVDMRRSYDGLMAIVQAEFARDIRLGDYFMFVNKLIAYSFPCTRVARFTT